MACLVMLAGGNAARVGMYSIWVVQHNMIPVQTYPRCILLNRNNRVGRPTSTMTERKGK